MNDSVFVEMRFWLLVVLSFGAPVVVYAFLISRRSIARWAVLLLGIGLVAISGIDAYLLQSLKVMALRTISQADDVIFASEISVALYAFPILYGGVGVNIVSHVVIDHLLRAERQADREHGDARRARGRRQPD